VKKLVSKFAFQVHNLQRYTEGGVEPRGMARAAVTAAFAASVGLPKP
jgi:hypothetical protein